MYLSTNCRVAILKSNIEVNMDIFELKKQMIKMKICVLLCLIILSTLAVLNLCTRHDPT